MCDSPPCLFTFLIECCIGMGCRNSRLFLQPFIQPVKEGTLPQDAVLRFQYPVVFILFLQFGFVGSLHASEDPYLAANT